MSDLRKNPVIIALDMADVHAAIALIKTLGEACTFYKIGYELSLAGGLALIDELKAQKKRVFLDWKLHDIGATVGKAVRQAEKLGVDFLTVHAYPQVMQAASEAKSTNSLKILGVTVLTSLTEHDLTQMGLTETNPLTLAQKRTSQAVECGIDGVITSPHEASALREILGPEKLIVTPGVRPHDSNHNDQKRTMTPEEALKNGADYLVIGRPVTQSHDPKQALEAIINKVSERNI